MNVNVNVSGNNMSSTASTASVNMQKWGIPEEEMVSAEITLLERLVWVPYKGHWWPALLYSNYKELQQHLYEELDMVLKAQFSLAIMRQMNESKQIKVARLLGSDILEVVEVDDSQYAEFYWQLPRVLPMACKQSRYGNDTKLYLDFHRALDQVEEIIRDISESSFNLTPGEGKKTWLQRAEAALKNPPDGSVKKPSKTRRLSPTNDQLFEDKAIVKAAIDKDESNFLFSAINGMMERINNTYDCVSGDVASKTIENDATFRSPTVSDNRVAKNKTSSIDAQSETLLKQKEYLKALRDVISKQQEQRETTPSPNVDARNSSSFDEHGRQVRQNVSTEVVYEMEDDSNNNSSTINRDWKPVGSKEEASEHDDEIFKNRSFSVQREYISSVPELHTAVNPKKYSSVAAQKSPKDTRMMVMESREEENPADEDREAIKATARAAAAFELEASFWDTLTCHTIDR